MIGFDRNTGKTLFGFDQFVSRVTQVMTTPVGSRVKRRKFGSKVPELLGRAMSDSLLGLAQSYAIEAFYEPENGLSDFVPDRCVALRDRQGLSLSFRGKWRGQARSFEVSL